MKISSFSEIEAEFIERVHAMVWCSAATLDTKNRPRSRILHPVWEGATGWVTTRPRSLKAKHIAHNPHISLAYIADVFKPVYVDCTAEWENDLSNKRRVWEWIRSLAPPLGFDPETIFESVESDGFGLLKLTPWRIELYDIANREDQRVWRR